MSTSLMILIAAITSGTPLLLAALGELVSEKSGVINLGLEGLMLVGALAGFATSHYTGNTVLGMLAAGLAGALLSSVHAMLVITLGCNQIVSGLSLAILGSGLSSFFGQKMIGQTAEGFGRILMDLDIIVFIAIALTIILRVYLRYTRWGLNLASVGHNPVVSDASGLNVIRIRYTASIFGGFMAGIGGAYLSLAYTRMWIDNMVAGKGWIAIAIVIFSMWEPIKTLIGAYLFGAVIAITMRIQASGSQVPVYILNMFPYIVTIIALIVITVFENFRRKSGAPESIGVAFTRR